jgi:type I restriction enzyme M protein
MAVVLPHGVLFRGSSEGVIRQYLIEKMNVVDTIIGLPANIFYGTSIPTCILVLKKNRTHTGDILFIDASNDFEKQKNQNKLLPEHLDKIIAAFEQRQILRNMPRSLRCKKSKTMITTSIFHAMLIPLKLKMKLI